MAVDHITEIDKCLASTEKFDEAEELLLATWLLGMVRYFDRAQLHLEE